MCSFIGEKLFLKKLLFVKDNLEEIHQDFAEKVIIHITKRTQQ